MNKQIEEIAEDLAKHSFFYNGGCMMNYHNTAKLLYNAGYRKQSKPISCCHEKGVEWISVEERLPDQDGKYLAYTRRGFTVLSYYYALEGAFGFEHWDVTHWMPLPMPPKGGVVE